MAVTKMPATAQSPTNDRIAAVLAEVANVLKAQGATASRIGAYESAAAVVRDLAEPAADILARDGRAALEALPAVRPATAVIIDEFIRTGHVALLDRLHGDATPERLLAGVPGLGTRLAERIHAELGVESIEELELAAHDGRLTGIAGLGPRRIAGLISYLDSELRDSPRRLIPTAEHGVARETQRVPEPSVALLFEIDARYRSLAERGQLATVAPRRFNPDRRRWLPIMHMERDGWNLTAMFSNSAYAHRMQRTDDWVVIFFERDGVEGQRTLVTEYRGALAGRRIVRGREEESADHWAGQSVREPAAASRDDVEPEEISRSAWGWKSPALGEDPAKPA